MASYDLRRYPVTLIDHIRSEFFSRIVAVHGAPRFREDPCSDNSRDFGIGDTLLQPEQKNLLLRQTQTGSVAQHPFALGGHGLLAVNLVLAGTKL